MRKFLLGMALLTAACGCATMRSEPPPAATAVEVPKPQHPIVRVEGVDGTILRGQLLNGSVTVDCGQGELTLLTDHIKSIAIAPSGDTIDSDSIKVNGKIIERQFLLQSEHGVTTLLKERLRKIDFSPIDGSLAPGPASAPVVRATTVRRGNNE